MLCCTCARRTQPFSLPHPCHASALLQPVETGRAGQDETGRAGQDETGRAGQDETRRAGQDKKGTVGQGREDMAGKEWHDRKLMP